MLVHSSPSRLPRWGQVLALVLAVVVGGQGLPIQSMVQSLQHGAAHHQCDHPEGVCPMNPEGPYTCDHSSDQCDHPEGVCPMNPEGPYTCDHSSEAPTDEPTLRSCGTGQVDAVTATLSRWIPLSRVQGPTPRLHVRSQAAVYTIRSSQRVGDEIFHPPRRWAARSPA